MNKVRADFTRKDCLIVEASSNFIIANCNIPSPRFSHHEQKRHAEFIVKACNAFPTMEKALQDVQTELRYLIDIHLLNGIAAAKILEREAKNQKRNTVNQTPYISVQEYILRRKGKGK